MKKRNPPQGQREISIPTPRDWGDIPKDDLDMAWSFKSYCGKSCEAIRSRMLQNPIEGIDEVRWMPPKPFAYYLRCLADIVMTCPEGMVMASDLASGFLHLVEEKLESCPQGIRASRTTIRAAVEHVAGNQRRFDADVGIYGDFSQAGTRILHRLDAL